MAARLGGPAGLLALSLLAVPASAAGSAAAGSAGEGEAASQREWRAEEAGGARAGRRGWEGAPEPPTGKNKPWCGPDFCYSKDGASCFDRYRADYCMHRVYICMKNFFEGGECHNPGLALTSGLGAASATASGDRLVRPAPPPPAAQWSAADWAAALSTVLLAIAVAATAISRASELVCKPTARGVDKSPLLV